MECPTLDRGFYGGPQAIANYNSNHGWASYSRVHKNLTVVFARNPMFTPQTKGGFDVGPNETQFVTDLSSISFSVPDTIPGSYIIKRQGFLMNMESNWLMMRNESCSMKQRRAQS